MITPNKIVARVLASNRRGASHDHLKTEKVACEWCCHPNQGGSSHGKGASHCHPQLRGGSCAPSPQSKGGSTHS